MMQRNHSRIFVYAMLLVLAFIGVRAIAQNQAPPLQMASVMTDKEWKDSGVAGLSIAQRKALDEWLLDYTVRLGRIFRERVESGPTYTGGSTGHWLSDKTDGGGYLTLEDDSHWEVFSLDRIDSMLWLPTDNVVVIKAKNPSGKYNYRLVNKSDKKSILAYYVGND
jgi:hypothetical protein